MRIIFICGSPRKKESCSYQIARYVSYFLDDSVSVDFLDLTAMKLHPDFSSKQEFRDTLSYIESADIIVWAFGVHVGYVPATMKLFLDYLFQYSSRTLFKGRAAAAICTSGRLQDDAALRRISYVSQQLGMGYLGEISVLGNSGLGYEEELETESNCRTFAGILNRALIENYIPPIQIEELDWDYFRPEKSTEADHADLTGLTEQPLQPASDIVLVLGSDPEIDPVADKWVRFFNETFNGKIKILPIAGLSLKKCTACLWCNQFGEKQCVIKDDLKGAREILQNAERLIFITPISSYSESYPLKVLLDRLWIDIHQGSLAPSWGIVIGYGGGPTTHDVIYYLNRFLRLLGINIVGTMVDEGGDAAGLFRNLNWNLSNWFTRTQRKMGIYPQGRF